MKIINILKIYLILQIIYIILKNFKNNNLEKFNIIAENFSTGAPVTNDMPWHPDFKYKGKQTDNFDLGGERLIGNANHLVYTKDDDGSASTIVNSATKCENLSDGGSKNYIYLDERYSNFQIPYSVYFDNDQLKEDETIKSGKYPLRYERSTDFKPIEYVPILLPNVKEIDDGTGTGNKKLVLDKPTTIYLSYNDKPINIVDTSTNALCKTYPSSSSNANEPSNLSTIRTDCARHQGYCSFLDCTKEYCKT